VDAEAMFLKRDIGKGGWSNKFADENGPGSEHKTVIIYISRRKSSLSLAVKSDKGGDDGEFGTQLGIPDCCIGFYLENREKAYTKQNDFVSLVYQNTKELTSFNFWNNFVSQYFGYSLLSHFPCSFNCMRSASLAMNCFEEVRNVLPEQAEKTKYYQKQPILYTEYRGVYMFENGKTYGDTTYINDCIIHSTLNENAKTAKYVLSLASIRILSKKTICLTSKNGDEKTVSNSNYAMCTFDENF
jgi:hypothetical protein